MSSSRYPYLEWREVIPGHWEREIDEAERFYAQLAKSYQGSGRMFFAITGYVSLSIEIQKTSLPASTGQRIDEALRCAWLRLRYDYPTIASQVDYDPFQDKWIKSYAAFGPDSVTEHHEQWLRQTFVIVHSKVSGLEWCNSDLVAPKVPKLFIIIPASSEISEGIIRRELVIRSPHDIMDGIGTLQLLNNLLMHAAEHFGEPSAWKQPQFDREPTHLSPPLRVAAAIPPILTLDQQDRLQRIIAHNALLTKEHEVLTLPYKKGAIVPGKHQRVAMELSEPKTTRLLQACRDIEATVTHVYHTAIACRIRDLQESAQESRQARYINYCLINERPQCKDVYSTAKHAAAVYHSVSGESLVLDLMIPSIKDKAAGQNGGLEEFKSLVGKVKAFYQGIRNSPDNLALTPCFWSMATPHLSDPGCRPHETPIPMPNTSPSVSISSMGVVDKIISPRHGAFKVENPWVTGEELGTGFGVFLGTWEGRLQLSMAYNDAWHDKKEAEEFLENCQRIVWQGLGIED